MIMERIYPPMIKTWMLRDGDIIEIDSLSELGIYSCIFMNTDNINKVENKSNIFNEFITFNKPFGTLMRTKGSHSNEGGVNTGYAVIDQPILYIEKKGIINEKI